MTIDLLDAPLRVTWDLHGENGALSADQAIRLAEELVAAGVFFVTLEERPLMHPAVREILHTLAAGGVRPMLTCDGSDDELANLERGLPIGTLFLDARCFFAERQPDFEALMRAVIRVRDRGYEPSLLMTPLHGNIHAVPALMDFCRQARLGKFKLPNVKIGDSFCRSMRADLLRSEDIEKLRLLVGEDRTALNEGVALEIHDLFLWEVLSPGREEGRSEYGGCQAGNSLAHVDATGMLYPCSSWPEKLGSLLQRSLEELWCSPMRYRIRQEIDAAPEGCTGCRDYPLCFGGCRGLARILRQAAGGRDPLCTGPR